MLFDRWVIPPIAPVSEAWETAGWAVHGIATKLLMALLLVHVAGALKREMDGDGTLDADAARARLIAPLPSPGNPVR